MCDLDSRPIFLVKLKSVKIKKTKVIILNFSREIDVGQNKVNDLLRCIFPNNFASLQK